MVNEPSNGGVTPLRWAAYNGLQEVIQWWIASGREMDLGTPGDIYKTDAIGTAKKQGKTEVVSLLERDPRVMPEGNQAYCRGWNLVWYDEVAAQMFTVCGVCLLILPCDTPFLPPLG